ncbi:hypothetical protein [Paenibacillus tepidiphilus]|uniref:hypothetical protein n=1 Tax=Paenibacillus tepidiphilus TaxID=2608683 RepID=UPI001238C34B|nr:hypothetical protein [Paenibacillus tepidiphilus]
MQLAASGGHARRCSRSGRGASRRSLAAALGAASAADAARRSLAGVLGAARAADAARRRPAAL